MIRLVFAVMKLRAAVLLTVAVLLLGAAYQAQAQLASTPWPMFRHDLQHTGRSPYLGPSTPAVKWIYEFDISERSAPAIGADGTIYVGAHDHNLYAMNTDGTLKWKFDTGSSVFSSPAVGADGTIYVVSSRPATLHAVNANGTLKWVFVIEGFTFDSPAVGPDGSIYVCAQPRNDDDGQFPGGLYAVNPDGTLKWRLESTPAAAGVGLALHVVSSSPALGVDGTIYVGGSASTDDATISGLLAVSPNGTMLWVFPTDSTLTSAAVGADGIIYLGTNDHNLYAVNPDGSLKWIFATGEAISSSPAIGADGTIYLGSEDKNLYAINFDGTLKWSLATEQFSLSSTVSNDGTIYVLGSTSLSAVNPDGTIKWSLAAGSSPAEAPTLGADGILYMATHVCGVAVCSAGLIAIGTGNTPAGADVTIPLGTGAAVTFGIVAFGGDTMMTTTTSVPAPTQGFSLDGVIYDIRSNATFTGPVLVCLPYGSGSDPNTLFLLHYDNDTWLDVTTTRDTGGGRICGEVWSLSPFALAHAALPFSGFFQPVDNLPVFNALKAGKAVPVKFSLAGDRGLTIFAEGYPKSQTIACSSNAMVDAVEATLTAGGSSLSYDKAADQYVYVWKTETTWRDSCRQLVVKFKDGTLQRANFRFTK